MWLITTVLDSVTVEPFKLGCTVVFCYFRKGLVET